MKNLKLIFCMLASVTVSACCDSKAACESVTVGMSQTEALEPFCPGTSYEVNVDSFEINAPDGSSCHCPTTLSDSTINGSCRYNAAP